MATRLTGVYGTQGNNNIGQLNSKWTKHVPNGAILDDAKVENYTLVEVFYNAEGELHCKQLTDVTKKGYLVTTVEEDQLMDGETYVDFFNAKDEIIRITDVKEQTGSRFETSAITLNPGGVEEGTKVTEIKNGQVAHFDPTSKTYIISASAADAASKYATSVNKFKVVEADSDFGYTFDKTTIRLESI